MKLSGEENAYPYHWSDGHGDFTHQDGLTIRQYYAGLAMAANSDNDDMTPEQVAIEAVQYADALINELNKEK